ncbi:MAG: prenyltransferase [Propionibacterium sp.]|nr:prenyltransferase [Propionibacterium sp.]
MNTVRMLVATSRPLSWINTAYPFALVLWLLTRQVDATLVVGTLFFLLPYNLAMYGVNDVFDHESDLLNPRKGGVEGALVPRRRHRTILVAVVVLTVPSALALAVLAGPLAALVLAVVLFAVLAYSAPHLRFKEIPFLDSATSATHFVGPALVGLAAAVPLTSVSLATREVALPLVAFFLWSMASQAFGAVQDVVPDRQAGLRSVATQIGPRATVRLAAAGYLLASLLLLLAGGAAGWVAPLCLVYALSVLPWWGVTVEKSADAHAGWVRFLWLNYLVGFLVTMVVIAAVNGVLPT